MPRSRRPPEGPTVDPIREELDTLVDLLDRSRLAEPGMTQAKLDAEKARSAAKWTRRKAKALAKWDRMTVLERKAWSDAYYLEARRQRPNAKPAPAAELPLLFAIITIAERDNAKAAKAYEARKAAAAAENAALPPNHRTPRTTSASPAPEEPATDAELPKPGRPRKRRRGPAFGAIGRQIDGVFHPYVTDDDDD